VPTVLVLGANGRFGQAAAAAFAAAGWRVQAQVRRAPASLPAGAVPLELPLEDTAALVAQAASSGPVRAVVYAINPVYTEWTQKMMPLARQGMAVAEQLGALFMLPGNVYGFGEGMPALLREDTPERPTTLKGQQREALEAELRSRAAAGRLKAAVIRAGDFYGQGSGSWLDQVVVKSLAQGKLVYPGPLDVPHAWAYLPDLAVAFVALASQPLAQGPAYRALHFAGHTLTGRELLAAIEIAADSLGLRPGRGWRRGGMPWAAVRAIGIFMPMMRELARMSYLWRVPHALDGAALERAVGPLPATPPTQALRAALLDLGFGEKRSAASAEAVVAH
jgi:nucleoside-diphosphate-sugar epimerase